MSYIPKQLVLLSSQTASNSASIEFKSVITSKYTTYVLKIRDLIGQTNGALVTMLWSVDNGANYLASNYAWNEIVGYAATSGATGSDSDTKINLMDSLNNTQPYNSTLTFYDANTSYRCFMVGEGISRIGANNIYHTLIAGTNTTATINAIKVVMSANNITSGNFYFYGVVEP